MRNTAAFLITVLLLAGLFALGVGIIVAALRMGTHKRTKRRIDIPAPPVPPRAGRTGITPSRPHSNDDSDIMTTAVATSLLMDTGSSSSIGTGSSFGGGGSTGGGDFGGGI